MVYGECRIRGLNGAALTFDYSKWPQKSVALEPFVGASGLLLAHKLSVRGADDQDHIILAAVTDKGDALDAKTAARLFELPVAGIKEQAFSAPDPVKSVPQARRQSILDDMAARQLPGGRGYFGFNESRAAYVEVLQYSQIVKDARLHHEAFSKSWGSTKYETQI